MQPRASARSVASLLQNLGRATETLRRRTGCVNPLSPLPGLTCANRSARLRIRSLTVAALNLARGRGCRGQGAGCGVLGSFGFVFLRKTAFSIAPGRIGGFVWQLFFCCSRAIFRPAAFAAAARGGRAHRPAKAGRPYSRITWGLIDEAGERSERKYPACMFRRYPVGGSGSYGHCAVSSYRQSMRALLTEQWHAIPRGRGGRGKSAPSRSRLRFHTPRAWGLGQHNKNFARDRCGG
jgi:hypothetical protein